MKAWISGIDEEYRIKMIKMIKRALRKATYLRATFVAAMVCLFLAPLGVAQTKRALLIGINTYEGKGTKITRPKGVPSTSNDGIRGSAGASRWDLPEWGNLEGSLNDVEAVHALLASPKFGFAESNIHTLQEQKATRDGILGAMKNFLLDEPKSGDTVVFYYAGHGSQRYNSLSDKPLHLDETIVPSDASSGAFDIRDKEIARLFTQVAAKGILLTAIFDSCHSGSIARGIPVGAAGKARFLAYDQRDAADPPDRGSDGKVVPAPQDRPGGPLVLSATQHDQSALEWMGADNKPHGAFTVAIIEALGALPANSPAQDIYKRVKVLLLGMGLPQQPSLDGNADRRKQSLVGTSAGTERFTVAVRPEGVNADGTVELDGGLAVGLGAGSELRKVTTTTGQSDVRLRVTQVRGLARSRAEILGGGAREQIQAGDLFELVRWAAPPASRLQVWMPSASLSVTELRAVAEELAKLRQQPNVEWIDDPWQSDPGYVMSWNGTEWVLTKYGNAQISLGRTPTAVAVLGQLPANAKVGFFLALPPASDLRQSLKLGRDTDNSAVEVAADPGRAQYLLTGRWTGRDIEYAWLKKSFDDEDSKLQANLDEQGNICAADSPYPPRTNWLAVGPTVESREKAAIGLTQYADRLARVRAWLELPAPPEGASNAFPYRLALKKMDAGTGLNDRPHQAIQDGEVVEGESYGLVLRAEGRVGAATPRRWVYVLAIDCNGQGQLLYPISGEGNYLPERGLDATWPVEIALTPKDATFTIGSPFGLDTYIMLSTAEQIADLSAFNFSGVVHATRGTATSPLAQLLGNASANARGTSPALPVNWSVQYMPIRSVSASRRLGIAKTPETPSAVKYPRIPKQ